MSKLPNDCICLFYFQVGWGGGGVVWGWPYLINSLQIKPDSHPAVLLNSLKFCAPVVFVWFWLFLSCLRRRGGGGGGGGGGGSIREGQILQFFSYT